MERTAVCAPTKVYASGNAAAHKNVRCGIMRLAVFGMATGLLLAASAQAATRVGGWTFVATTVSRGEHTLTTLRIDSPTASARAWNAWAKTSVDTAYALTDEVSRDGKPLPGTSVTVAMSVVAASPDLISVTTDSSSGDDGMAEVDNRHAAATWLVRPRRQLTGDDLFDKAKPWATALARVAQRHLRGGDGELDKIHRIRRVDQAGGEWQITAKGLSISYDDWRSAGTGNGAETDLSWTELKPWLRKDLPFDPAKIQTAPGT